MDTFQSFEDFIKTHVYAKSYGGHCTYKVGNWMHTSGASKKLIRWIGRFCILVGDEKI